MSSYWTPFGPTQESDYYRPNVTLKLDRPPRPGPRQPDCWRPGQKTSALINIKQEDFNPDSNKDIKKQKQKQPKGPNPNYEPLGRRRGETTEDLEISIEPKKQKVKQPRVPNPNKVPLGRCREESSEAVDNSSRLTYEADYELLNRGQEDCSNGLETDRKAKKQKVNLLKLPNPKIQPLGKCQMGVINSIMRVEGQKRKTTNVDKIRTDELTLPQVESVTTELDVELDEVDSTYRTTKPQPSHHLSEISDQSERASNRPSLLANPLPTDRTWSRTNISSNLPIMPDSIMPPSIQPQDRKSTSSYHQPTQRQKLDFGNRVDQCLLKMDKWADAWLSNAFENEAPNSNPDNAWSSFEYCLSMPDVLEEGEIIEYEEIPRRELPFEVSLGQSQVIGVKRKRIAERSTEDNTLIETRNKSRSCVEERGMILNLPPMIARPEKRVQRTETDGRLSRIEVDDTDSAWTKTRERRSVESSLSSSPGGNDTKIAHIPSAAELREGARSKMVK